MHYAQMRAQEQEPRWETGAGCMWIAFIACGARAGWVTEQFVRSTSDTAPSFACGSTQEGHSPNRRFCWVDIHRRPESQNCSDSPECRVASGGGGQKRKVNSGPEGRDTRAFAESRE